MQIETDKILNPKLRGGFYTPQPIADFICRWAIKDLHAKVLEPSCGDGNFIEAAIKRLIDLGATPIDLLGRVKGIELMEIEATKAKERAANLGLNSKTIENTDFFQYIYPSYGQEQYDVIVGNPPFIRYQNFPEEHRSLAFTLMERAGLKPNKLTNIWVPFLVVGATSLNANGKLGMVIPAELFQVKYAAQTRVFLSKFFSNITIITFRKLVFKDIQQEVVLLLCEKGTTKQNGIRVVEVDDIQSLSDFRIDEHLNVPVKQLEHDSEKWTKYFLEEDEISSLREIKASGRIKPCSVYMDVEVGLVTGCNDFFMLSKQMAESLEVTPYTRKVISKSAHFRGLVFNETDFEKLSEEQSLCHLFLPPEVEKGKLPTPCKVYVDSGEQNNYHKGYKCRIRRHWYITPSLWIPDAFALRQVGEYPKIILNEGTACSTDTIHRVRFKIGVNPRLAAVSFLNSLSFAFSEIMGRSYGGGVLTFEPSEIEEIPLPLLDSECIDLKEIDQLLRKKEIDRVLDIVDEALLIKQYGFDVNQVYKLRAIWRKMSNRRKQRGK